MTCSNWPSMIGSLVGVLLSDTTRLKLTLPVDLASGANVSLPKNAVLPISKSVPFVVL